MILTAGGQPEKLAKPSRNCRGTMSFSETLIDGQAEATTWYNIQRTNNQIRQSHELLLSKQESYIFPLVHLPHIRAVSVGKTENVRGMKSNPQTNPHLPQQITRAKALTYWKNKTLWITFESWDKTVWKLKLHHFRSWPRSFLKRWCPWSKDCLAEKNWDLDWGKKDKAIKLLHV